MRALVHRLRIGAEGTRALLASCSAERNPQANLAPVPTSFRYCRQQPSWIHGSCTMHLSFPSRTETSGPTLVALALGLALSAMPATAREHLGPYNNLLLKNPHPDAAGKQYGRGLAAGDFDGDGTSDLVVSEAGGDRLRVLRGLAFAVGSNPLLQFLSTTINMPVHSYTMASGDFDGDGRDEIAVSAMNASAGGQGCGWQGHDHQSPWQWHLRGAKHNPGRRHLSRQSAGKRQSRQQSRRRRFRQRRIHRPCHRHPRPDRRRGRECRCRDDRLRQRGGNPARPRTDLQPQYRWTELQSRER